MLHINAEQLTVRGGGLAEIEKKNLQPPFCPGEGLDQQVEQGWPGKKNSSRILCPSPNPQIINGSPLMQKESFYVALLKYSCITKMGYRA